MVKTEKVTIQNKDYIKIYSDAGFKILQTQTNIVKDVFYEDILTIKESDYREVGD
jgi:hypothetical protein